MDLQRRGIQLLRIWLGITMLAHGLAKVTALSDTTAFFNSVGLPSLMVYLVAAIEVIGGAFMIIGLLIPLVALGFVAVLVGAIFTLKLSAGFLNGYEYELFLAVASLAILLMYGDKKYLRIALFF